MNDQNNDLLVNPTPEDFQDNPETSNQDANLFTKDQLQMDLDSSGKIQQIVTSSKMTLRKRNELLELSMLWKTPALPFAISSLAVDLLILIVGGIAFFNAIPPKVPLFYDPTNTKWIQSDKSVVFILPIFIFIIEAIIIQLLIKIFRYDRRLSLVCFWILTFLNCLIFVIIAQFFSLLV